MQDVLKKGGHGDLGHNNSMYSEVNMSEGSNFHAPNYKALFVVRSREFCFLFGVLPVQRLSVYFTQIGVLLKVNMLSECKS